MLAVNWYRRLWDVFDPWSFLPGAGISTPSIRCPFFTNEVMTRDNISPLIPFACKPIVEGIGGTSCPWA